jgi:alkylated DNA repair dioxygenase AlkB
VRVTLPWIDYEPAFLEAGRAKQIFDWINLQRLIPETGKCKGAKPTHDTIQWGPRQAYLACVPAEYRVISSGPIPDELLKLHGKIEQRYRATFNTIQVNRHWNEKSNVGAHSDMMHGDIVMLSLGAPRRFILRHKHDHKANTPKWKAGDIFFDEELPNGSLLTILKRHQFDLTHEMPVSPTPCGARISLIWRYITSSLAVGNAKTLSRQGIIDGQPEFLEAQRKWQVSK